MWEIFGWCWTHEMYDNDFLPLPTPYEWTFVILTIKWSNKNINGGVYKFWIFQGYAFVTRNHFTFLKFSFVVVLKNQLNLSALFPSQSDPKGWNASPTLSVMKNITKTKQSLILWNVKRTKESVIFPWKRKLIIS